MTSRGVCGILRKVKKLKDNLTREQRKALRELRKNMIIPADKGKATVLMMQKSYYLKQIQGCWNSRHMKH